MSNLALIQPQRFDFATQQTCDWLTALPIIGQPAPGGVAAGSTNVGSGTLTVASVAASAPLGAYVVVVTAVAGGLAHLSVTDPTGTLVGQGIAGVALSAGGIALTLAQGATAFAVGDSFAVGVLPQPIDLTSLRFDLDSRIAQGSATYALQASSAASPATILNGAAAGKIALQVPRATMAACPPGDYPYSILATDPVSGLTVPAFYGLIHHRAVAAQIGS